MYTRENFRYRIKKDDLVEVIMGRDRGKRGKVLKVFPDSCSVIVNKVNIVKRHQKPNQQMREGGIIDKNLPIKVSKVMVVCPNCDKPTRVGKKMLEGEGKSRYCKKCGEMIDKA